MKFIISSSPSLFQTASFHSINHLNNLENKLEHVQVYRCFNMKIYADYFKVFLLVYD